MSGFGLGAAELQAHFPFHLVIDQALVIQQVGAVLPRLCPDLRLGDRLDQHFAIKRPRIAADYAAIVAEASTVFILAARDSTLQLKGQMLPLPAADAICFLASPWITEMAGLQALGLSLTDFPIHDPISDFLFVIQAHQTSVADVKRLNARLLQQREEREQLQAAVISAQAAALNELSSPLIPISAEIVVMPLIGSIDDQRAGQILEALLTGIGTSHAEVAIVDITGVPVVDSHVAQALVQAAQAVRLLGADIILTGIRPEVAQALVSLGLELGSLVTHRDLQSGIAHAMRTVGR